MILGFDFGMKYIGVASGQLITKTATPLTCLRAVDGIPDWAEIQQLIDTWKPTTLIIGKPPADNSSTQLLVHCIQKFANRMQHKYKIPIILVDEHLSTWEAKHELLRSPTKLDNKQLATINAKAAAIIVTQWLQEQ